MKETDITGKRFGKLTAIRSEGVGPCWRTMWMCHCDCGRDVTVYKNNLVSGHTRSCGCLRRDRWKPKDDETTVGR